MAVLELELLVLIKYSFDALDAFDISGLFVIKYNIKWKRDLNFCIKGLLRWKYRKKCFRKPRNDWKENG